MGETGWLRWFVRGGSKTRKLEFQMANAVTRKATKAITLGITQPDLARQSAAIASDFAMERHLLMLDPPEIRTLKDWPHGAVWRRCAGRTDGDEIGAPGYVKATLELVRQANHLGLSVDLVVRATGNAGIEAGLVAGFPGS